MTYKMALTWAVGMGVEPSDARWLLQEVARISMADYLLDRDGAMNPEQMLRFEQMVRRRARGEPVQHVLGYWDFCDLTLKTDNRGLIPRPETELLVEEALRLMDPEARLDVADVGCGGGCIGLALKSRRLRDRVTLLDISEDALTLARENSDLLRLNVRLLPGDMKKPLPGGPYDVLCANPPYIPTADCDRLDDEVKGFDPLLALDGGADGLDFYRALADRMEDSLRPGALAVLEIGIGQAQAVEKLFAPKGRLLRLREDLAGIPRIMSFKKT